MILFIAAIALGLSVAYLFLRLLLRPSPRAPPPPGPKGLPLIGNLLDMPRQFEWLKFSEWAKQYGNIVSVSALGQTYVIVNSAEVAIEMNKKAYYYSDRPEVPMIDLTGWNNNTELVPYSRMHLKHRRLFHQAIGTNVAVGKFHHLNEQEAHRLLKLFAAQPDDFLNHIRKITGSLILRTAFGYEMRDENDVLASIADNAMAQFALISSPENFLVNYIPALQYLPDWFPGTGFKRTIKECARSLTDMVENPYLFVKQEMSKGTAQLSVVSELLADEPRLSQDDIQDIKWTAQSFYSGGSNTTVSTLYGFIKAMVLYPEVQAKAQAEIDAVIGHNRLPTTADRERLPYLSALLSEVLRWHVVKPCSGPHRVLEDDIHDGYFIPQGSTVLFNVWSMTRNSNVYRRPEVFDPTRFLKTETRVPEPDPRSVIFGFGKRTCAGRFLADSTIFITCAMILAAFDITPHIENGKPVWPDTTQEAGFVSHPSTFKCNILPRSDKALALVTGS